jgi:2-iminobutanoate/2-iminopropanoate deaminase
VLSRQACSITLCTHACTHGAVGCNGTCPAGPPCRSQAIKAGNTVYVSGQIGLVPGTKDFASPDVEGQAEQVMKNMRAILEAAGGDFSNVVK